MHRIRGKLLQKYLKLARASTAMVGRVAETSARRFDAFGEVCFAWRIFGADLHLQ